MPLQMCSWQNCVRRPGMNWKWKHVTVLAVATRVPSLQRWTMMEVSASPSLLDMHILCLTSAWPKTFVSIVINNLIIFYWKCCCSCFYFWVYTGTIAPIKSPLEKNDDVKKLFSIGCPVILVTVGIALLFIIRKKRKEKRLKRLRGEKIIISSLGKNIFFVLVLLWDWHKNYF